MDKQWSYFKEIPENEECRNLMGGPLPSVPHVVVSVYVYRVHAYLYLIISLIFKRE